MGLATFRVDRGVVLRNIVKGRDVPNSRSPSCEESVGLMRGFKGDLRMADCLVSSPQSGNVDNGQIHKNPMSSGTLGNYITIIVYIA